MDILNFISWIKGGRVVKTVDPAQTLLPVGLKDNRRDDGYLAGAISVQDLVTQITPVPAYKVYTALLLQIGGSDSIPQTTGNLIIGCTYIITYNSPGMDFTNVGAINNELGTYFIATGTTPNSWGSSEGDEDILIYNAGAPVATVMENTLGFNPIFTYVSPGRYIIRETYIGEMYRWQQNNTPITVFINCGNYTNYEFTAKANFTYEEGIFYINSFNLDVLEDNVLSDFDRFYKTSLEIRVYE